MIRRFAAVLSEELFERSPQFSNRSLGASFLVASRSTNAPGAFEIAVLPRNLCEAIVASRGAAM